MTNEHRRQNVTEQTMLPIQITHFILPIQKQESPTLVYIARYQSINHFWKSPSHHCHRSHKHL